MDRSQIRILIVEDDEEVRGLIQQLLCEAGFSPDTAGCGRDAREKASQQRYHLLLVDLMLPDESGLKVIEGIAAHQDSPAAIILTGRPSVDTAAEGMRHGVRNYLTKPVSAADLIRAVELVLSSDGLLIDSEAQFLVELGKRLKTARQGADLTMRTLGGRINISQAQISQIEAGLSAPSLATLFRLARALRVKLSDLMQGF
jgi:DNA-binding response OmpR family regulator